MIVTFNLKDFPDEELNKYDIEPQHPDEFIHNLFDLDSAAVVDAVKRQRASLKNPPIEVAQFLSTLQKQHLAKPVDELRNYSDVI